MERCEQRENQVALSVEPPSPSLVAEQGEGERGAAPPSTSFFVRWETLILKQILVCIFIIFFLWVIGKIPGIGSGMVDRFRHVLKYGESNQTEEKVTAFAREQWGKVKKEVSSWFTVDWQPVMAPAGRRLLLSSPLLHYEQREVYPERIRFLLAPNTVVYASASGVVRAVSVEKGGWKLDLDHGEGWHSIYYPCARVHVKTGEWVNPGQEIASTGREFFWEITNGGYPVDPRPFIAEEGVWR